MSTFTDSSKRPPMPTDAARPGQPTGTRTTTVLTSDCEFKGALAFSGELELHGRLEGTIESEGGALTVGEQALIKAEIKVNDVLIYGKVQGNIYATGRIELRGKAEVYGDLNSNRLAMDDGVIFVGRSNALNGKSQAPADFNKMFTRLGTVAKTNSTGAAPANAATAKSAD
jgi:cytoskeletal protein CcmA (bactofilin family)